MMLKMKPLETYEVSPYNNLFIEEKNLKLTEWTTIN